ncbi:ABC transporter permease [Gorillibacterium sp. sgz5001074]|uniref:ABC transporter permease n=1 Tax=Gorillibacterium sp. sgz5001074 TaxID=3446695 RepID=UPI003F6792D8
MKLYLHYIRIGFKSQMQYRASFWLLAFGQFFIPFFVFAGLVFLFDRFGQIRGWTFAEVALSYAIINMAFAVSVCFARGFDSFSSLVVNGEFDRLLVRPRTTALQVIGYKFEFNRVGRLLQGGIVFVWALWSLPLDWTFLRVLTLFLMIASGTCIFTGLYILAATLCFWTVQGLEVANIFTDGGRELAQYPIQIYQKAFARFFTFIVPFGCANYYPLLYVLGRTDPGISSLPYLLAPLWGIAFLVPCLLIWRFGVRHYRSTGS